MIEKVYQWWASGEDYRQGVQLLREISNDAEFFEVYSISKIQQLKNKIFSIAKCKERDLQNFKPPENLVLIPATPQLRKQLESFEPNVRADQNTQVARQLREAWYPKIDWKNAPDVIAVLVMKQITAYWAYKDLHEKLKTTIDEAESYLLCVSVIENVKKNRDCIEKLKYFNDHGKMMTDKMDKKAQKKASVIENSDPLEVSRLLLRTETELKRTERLIEKNKQPGLNTQRLVAIEQFKKTIEECKQKLKR